ncbi:MAG: AAA family ATPase [Steroidobacteraceae bacterium]
MSTALQQLESVLQDSLGTTVIGMRSTVHALTIAVVARGHVLIQGAPGLGKTLLSKMLAAALGGTFKRIQGTADLMPSDIIGVHVYDGAHRDFVFHPGPLFADVLLFDEINRAGPKTQSALLEAMEERQVSVDRHLYPLPAGFFVVATQNPRDFEGTYPLPESQLDRFMLRIELPYPARADELEVLERYGRVEAPGSGPSTGAVPAAAGAAGAAVLGADTLRAARALADAVHVAPALGAYVLDLAKATREHTQVSLGLSTRGALALLRSARVSAGLRGADYVSPDDVKAVWSWVVPHRLVLASEALLEGASEQALAQRLLEQVPVPR